MGFFVFKPGCPTYWVGLLEYSRKSMTVISKVFKNTLNTLCSMKLYGKSEVLRQDGPISKCFNMKWGIFCLQWCKFSSEKPWDVILKPLPFSSTAYSPICMLFKAMGKKLHNWGTKDISRLWKSSSFYESYWRQTKGETVEEWLACKLPFSMNDR